MTKNQEEEGLEGVGEDEATEEDVWVAFVPVESVEVVPGWNIRKNKEPSEELVASVSKLGVINPIHVRDHPDDPDNKYAIIDGERRYRAALEAGRESVPIVFDGDIDDINAFMISLVANDHQQTFDQEEIVEAFKRLNEWGVKDDEIAGFLGRSQRWVQEMKDIFSKGSKKLQKAVTEGTVSTRAAQRTSSLPKKAQADILREVKEEMEGQGKKPNTEAVVQKVRAFEEEDAKSRERAGKVPKKARPGPKPDDFPWSTGNKKKAKQLSNLIQTKLEEAPKDVRANHYLEVLWLFQGDRDIEYLAEKLGVEI